MTITEIESGESHYPVNTVSACLFCTMYSCFAHIINLAVQAIYAALKDGKGLEEQYLLGNVDHFARASVADTDLPDGVTKTDYVEALEVDILGVARKLTGACRISGKHREELESMVLEGNQNEIWMDDCGESVSVKMLQLLRDCETRWSSTHSMVDRALVMLPVCNADVDLQLLHTQATLDCQRIGLSSKFI